jgi:molybdenum cofactor biosynthesis enzyme MoaA
MANEKRLIDANVLLEKLRKNRKPGYGYATATVGEMPTVDAVEVVRCKDCKHCTVTSDGMICECALPTKRMMDYYIYGSTILARVAADDFCSHGERRCE